MLRLGGTGGAGLDDAAPDEEEVLEPVEVRERSGSGLG